MPTKIKNTQIEVLILYFFFNKNSIYARSGARTSRIFANSIGEKKKRGQRLRLSNPSMVHCENNVLAMTIQHFFNVF